MGSASPLNVRKDFSITTISNGSSDFFKDNTLSRFTNRLPSQVVLNHGNKYEVALESIGISLNYETLSVPEKNSVMIYMFDYNLYELEIIKINTEVIKTGVDYSQHEQKIFSGNDIYKEKLILDPQYYSMDNIEKAISQFLDNSTIFKDCINFKFTCDEKTLEEFYYYHSDKEVPNYLSQAVFENICNSSSLYLSQPLIGLLIHEELFNTLLFNPNLIKKKIHLYKETYFLIKIPPLSEVRGGLYLRKCLPSIPPKFIEVSTNILSPYLSNGNFCKIISTISVPRIQKRNLFFSPRKLVFFPIETAFIDDITVSLYGDSFKQLNLSYGTPTITKFRIRKMKEEISANLRVSNKAKKFSDFDNKNSHFRVKFPRHINISHNVYKYGLTSITFPNRFKNFPSYIECDNLDIYMFNPTSKYKPLARDLVSTYLINKSYRINIPKSFYNNAGEFLYNLNQAIHQSTNAIECILAEDNSKYCSIAAHDNVIIRLPMALGEMMGISKNLVYKSYVDLKQIDSEDRTFIGSELKLITNNADYFLSNVILELDESVVGGYKNSIYICLAKEEAFLFHHEIDISVFKPQYIVLYNNIIENSIVDNKFSRIFKIIPVLENDNDYHTITFENVEYFKIQEHKPLYLEFIFSSSSGKVVEFADSSEEIILHTRIIKTYT